MLFKDEFKLSMFTVVMEINICLLAGLRSLRELVYPLNIYSVLVGMASTSKEVLQLGRPSFVRQRFKQSFWCLSKICFVSLSRMSYLMEETTLTIII